MVVRDPKIQEEVRNSGGKEGNNLAINLGEKSRMDKSDSGGVGEKGINLYGGGRLSGKGLQGVDEHVILLDNKKRSGL